MKRSDPVEPRLERELFIEALGYEEGAERESFLEHACAGNSRLRDAVLSLLANHRDDAFLQNPVSSLGEHKEIEGFKGAAPDSLGEKIGPYKLLQKIGEGGCGVVYMAEQEQPIRRRVALKVIKLGMDTRSVIARFEVERQALALMDHPNIAKVLDAGSTQSGRPYFVMELVRGIRITDYCDQNNVSTRERLWLFSKVCQAIQHAHQKGVIHRDIKPSNILITLHDGVPVPKIIDFGIAKAMDQRLTDKTLFTQFHAFVGTPAYTSPEQAEMSGLDIDTRSDIYSLGVILYELLTGKTPFDAEELAASGLERMRQTIREKEPIAPSTRLDTMLEEERTKTAQRHGSDPSRLRNVIRGDLDWIVMKALEKDRTHRYATAIELAQDIQRYLSNEPILARPPSSIYRFRKLVRRNKLPFAAAASFAIAMVLGLVITAWQIVEKNRAYRRALQAEEEQRQLHQLAEVARSNETRLRLLAETKGLEAQRKSYAATLNLSAQALAANNLGRARQLLDSLRPAPDSPDFRGWEWRYLWKHCQSEALFTLCKITNEISSITTSHDGRWVSLNFGSGNSIWDLWGRRELPHRPKFPESVLSVFSPTEPLLAIAKARSFRNRAGRQSLQLWDPQFGEVVRELELMPPCTALVFSADGARLLAATDTERLIIWEVKSGKLLESHAAPGIRSFRSGAAFSATGDLGRVAYPVEDGRIRVFNLRTEKEEWSAEAVEESVMALEFSPDGKLLASSGGFVESTIRIWDVTSGRQVGRLDGHRTWVSSLRFWGNGNRIASASGDQTIRLWDISALRDPAQASESNGGPSGELPALIRPLTTLRGHQQEIWSIAFKDETTLVSGSKDGTVNVWDLSTLKGVNTRIVLPIPVRAWGFCNDSTEIMTVDEKGIVSRWTGENFQNREQLAEIGPQRFGVTLSSTNLLLAASGPPGEIQVWDLNSGASPGWRFAGKGPTFPASIVRDRGETFLITQSLRPERSNSFQSFHLESGVEVPQWPEIQSSREVRFSKNARDFCVSTENGTNWSVFNLVTRQSYPLDSGFRSMGPFAIAPNGSLLATIGRDSRCNIWDIKTGKWVTSISGFLQGMHSVAFSGDSKRMAIGSNGAEAVKIWDAESFQEILTLDGKGSAFTELAFSSDGNMIGASNREGILHIWKAPSDEEIESFEAQQR